MTNNMIVHLQATVSLHILGDIQPKYEVAEGECSSNWFHRGVSQGQEKAISKCNCQKHLLDNIDCYVPILVGILFGMSEEDYRAYFIALLKRHKFNDIDDLERHWPQNICNFSEAERAGRMNCKPCSIFIKQLLSVWLWTSINQLVKFIFYVCAQGMKEITALSIVLFRKRSILMHWSKVYFVLVEHSYKG